MPTCVGLPGTKRNLEAIFIRKVAKLPATLKAGKCATAADDNGAISAWIDDAGKYRCEAYRRMRTIDSQTYASLKDVKKWYSEWLKNIA